eukprot:6046748-Pyramimonas_sp.AAC.1
MPPEQQVTAAAHALHDCAAVETVGMTLPPIRIASSDGQAGYSYVSLEPAVMFLLVNVVPYSTVPYSTVQYCTVQ